MSRSLPLGRWLATSLSSRCGRLPGQSPRRSRHPRSGQKLMLECLEDRIAPANTVLGVSSLADTGPHTLRQALTKADKGSPADTYLIDFSVTGTITLESALPSRLSVWLIFGRRS